MIVTTGSKRITRAVAEDDGSFLKALGPSSSDEIMAEHLEQARSRDAGDDRQRDGR